MSRNLSILGVIVVLSATLLYARFGISGEEGSSKPANQEDSKMDNDELSTATFGGGCFWCLEAVFERLRGVQAVESGYAGGHQEKPTYEEVCSGQTGHAEVVQISFDPSAINYTDLLDVFFSIHDPTTLNRQGADVGTQYRSIILYHSEEQKASAIDKIKQLGESKKFDRPIVTAVEPYKEFYKAEEYHQGYYDNNRYAGYCRVVIDPKLKKLEKEHEDKIK